MKEAEVCLTSKRNCQSTHLLFILEHAFGSGKPTTQEAQEVLLHTLRQVDTFYVYELQFLIWFYSTGFHHSSVGKESTCNAGDPSSIPGLGRSPGEGIGHPLQCSWASLVAQLVKNPPTMLETWLWSLGWEDPLERKWLPTLVFWPAEFHGPSMRSHRVRHDWTTFTFT